MKFRDIKKFTKSGSYQIDVPWNSLPKWIENQTREMDLQMTPLFQRGHVWNKKQQIDYIEFVLRGGQNGLIAYFNCPTWNDRDTIDGYDDFVCVDGLQRITAILAFIDNKIPAFNTYYKDFEDHLPLSANIKININDLKSEKQVLQWYIDMNRGGTPHTDEEIQKVEEMIMDIEERGF